MTTSATWHEHAAQLAEQLAERGDLTDPAWQEAVAATPRHVLVPQAYEQDSTGQWHTIDTASPAGLARTYSPTTLVTRLADRGSHCEAVSSSTKPDLIVRMLELLDLADGHRVLAVGTGSGYTTALLSHRLGSDNVASVDIDPVLVEQARSQLARLGWHPHLHTRDGADGLPDYAPYDRLLATCSVSRIPPAWIDQLAPGGVALVDVKLGATAGNLALLTRHHDRLQGRFTARWASFMPMRPDRSDGSSDVGQGHGRSRQPQHTRRSSTTPPEPWWHHRLVWLLAHVCGLPRQSTVGVELDPATGQPHAGLLSAPDGSWASIARTPNDDGTWQVTEGGATPLWSAVETADALHADLGGPDWPRFGLTATHRAQWLWFDTPDGAHTWPLPPAEGTADEPA